MTHTFSSRHWPSGAQFLTDLYAWAQEVARMGEPDAPLAAMQALASFERDGDATCSVYTWMRGLPTSTSGHTRLRLATFLAHAPGRMRAFLEEGADLPGLKAHARIPVFDLSTTGHDEAYTALHGTLMLAGPDRAMPTRATVEADLFDAFVGPGQFRSRAKCFLHDVDTLCDLVPDTDAPSWVAIEEGDAHRSNTPRTYGPFRANDAKQAADILPILAWDFDMTPTLLYQRAHDPNRADRPVSLLFP